MVRNFSTPKEHLDSKRFAIIAGLRASFQQHRKSSLSILGANPFEHRSPLKAIWTRGGPARTSNIEIVFHSLCKSTTPWWSKLASWQLRPNTFHTHCDVLSPVRFCAHLQIEATQSSTLTKARVARVIVEHTILA